MHFLSFVITTPFVDYPVDYFGLLINQIGQLFGILVNLVG